MNRHRYLEIIGDGIIITFGILSAILFTLIISNPERGVRIFENIAAIRWAECLLAYGIIILGIERAIDDLRKFRGR